MSFFRGSDPGRNVLRTAAVIGASMGAALTFGQMQATHLEKRLYRNQQIIATRDINRKLDDIKNVLRSENIGKISSTPRKPE